MALAIQSSREFEDVEEMVTKIFGQLRNKTDEDDPFGFYAGPRLIFGGCVILKLIIKYDLNSKYES